MTFAFWDRITYSVITGGIVGALSNMPEGREMMVYLAALLS